MSEGYSKLDPKGKDSLCDRMKNKIILLLVLLIPSLCFGDAVQVLITSYQGQNTISVSIDSTNYGKDNMGKIFNFKTRDGVIFKKDNEKEILMFFKFISVLYPKAFEEIVIYYKLTSESITSVSLQMFIEKVFLKNNYALTNKSNKIEGGSEVHFWHFYNSNKAEQSSSIKSSLTTAGEFNLKLAAIGPIGLLIIDDQGEGTPKDFKDLDIGWESEITISKSFRCHCSDLENLRFSIDNGSEKKIDSTGAGNFSWSP